MPPKKPPPPPPNADDEDDIEDDELDDVEDDEDDGDEDDDEDDESSEDEDDEFDDDGEEFSDGDAEASNAPKSNGSARAARDAAPPRVRARRDPRRARGLGGMGRPSTGPRVRAATRAVAARAAIDVSLDDAEPESAGPVMTVEEPETEIAPDISSWPGTSEAAKLVGRHTSTVKLWRQQGRIRALQDASNCWRYHPDDLAEAVETPDAVDPGSVLASGMTAIVQQGAQANDRLLAMTELTTDGLKETILLLREELKRVYARNAELEKNIAAERDKNVATHTEDLKHERYMRRLDQGHEVRLAGAHETSARLSGLLTMLGPIAASIGARLLGDITGAEKAEAQIAAGTAAPGSKEQGASSEQSPSGPNPQTPNPKPSEDRLVPLEARILDGMARLTDAIRKLDQPAFAGLRAMLPPSVAEALDAVVRAESDGTVGKALAVIIQAAQNLSDLQFAALKPIAPLDIATVLADLRVMLREQG